MWGGLTSTGERGHTRVKQKNEYVKKWKKESLMSMG